MEAQATPPPTTKQDAVTQVLGILAEAIKDLGSIPNGHLYAMVMSKLSFESYTGCISILKRQNLISESHHLLTWVGPADWKIEDYK